MLLIVTVGGAASGACTDLRTSEPMPPTWNGSVARLISERCVSCHGASEPEGGWNASTYLDAIACTAAGEPAVVAGDDRAPIVRALASASHQGLVSADERGRITEWNRLGSPKLESSIHDPSYANPRSPLSHGPTLRAANWRPMIDPSDEGACGRCHEGVPSRPANVTASTPGATPCTTCHSEPEGVLACSTCHGSGTVAFLPRNPCFHPEDTARAGAHRAHAETRSLGAAPLTCTACHPVPDGTSPSPADRFTGAHGNGFVDVAQDAQVAGPNATFDATSRRCANECHTRPGGARREPAWTDAATLKCNDCHGSPPPTHAKFAGKVCTACHAEANTEGTMLVEKRLHLNGRVDLGDGSSTCGACHGKGDDPWPATGAHAAHRAPKNSAAVPCSACHEVPNGSGEGFDHPKGGATRVVFSGLATKGGLSPTFSEGSCREVYCHGGAARPSTLPALVWADTASGATGLACNACHGTPPPAPHPQAPGCDFCHRSVADSNSLGPIIRPESRARHVDGIVDK